MKKTLALIFVTVLFVSCSTTQIVDIEVTRFNGVKDTLLDVWTTSQGQIILTEGCVTHNQSTAAIICGVSQFRILNRRDRK